MRRTVVGLGVVGSLLVGLGVVQLLPGSTPLAVQPAEALPLVAYDSCDALLADVRADLVETAGPDGWSGGYGGDFAAGARVSAPVPTAASPQSLDAVGSGPTGTNLQEQDVDEPDVTKLSGDRLVTVAAGALDVVRTGAAPVLLGRLPLAQQTDVNGPELLVDGDRVLVVSQGWRQASPGAPGTATTTLDLADLSDPAAPRWVDRWSIDGDEVSARLSTGAVRLVTRTHPTPVPAEIGQPFGPEQEAAALAQNRAAAGRLTLDEVLPEVRRTPTGGTTESAPAVDCHRVNVAPDSAGGGLLLVTTLEPSRGLAPTDSVGVVADGDLVYASSDRLVVATSRWGTRGGWSGRGGGWGGPGRPTEPVTTTLHTFDTSDATTTRYVASGEVSGFLLGRWALSYDAGHLRAVTTEEPVGVPGGGPFPAPPLTIAQPPVAQPPVAPPPVAPAPADPRPADPPAADSVVPVPSDRSVPAPPGPSLSTLTVLDEQGGRLVRTGSVSGLGRGEQVRAVRFFGDLATVVTFRRTDPLYVVDLSDPTNPSVTGELKVTGFSTYLHPLGGDLVLGLGNEASPDGRVSGLQASAFDVSDRARPTQVSRVQLGQGYSPALEESRAFTYDPVRRQMLLLNQRDDPGAPPESLRAVSVSTGGELRETASMGVVLGDAHRARVLVDGSRVYTVTAAGVQAADADLVPTGSLSLR